MDEHEFQRLLHLFPVVRTRDYCQANAESSAESSRASGNELKDWQDAWGEQETKTQDDFWDKLKSSAEKKVGPAEAKRFCDAFQKIYHKLVHEELSREAIESFLNSS